MIAVMVNSLAGGGAERVALNLLQEYRRLGQECLLICIEKEQHYQIPDRLEVIYLTDFHRLTNPVFKLYMVMGCSFKLKRLVALRNIKVVQSHLIRSNMINTGAKMLGSKHKSQLISHCPLPFSDNSFVRFVEKRLYRFFYNKSDQLVSISKLMQDHMRKDLGKTPDKMKQLVIPNPHDLQLVQSMSKEEPIDFQFQPATTYIVSAGRLRRHKRVDEVIMALNHLRHKYAKLELIILGEGDMKPEYQRMIEELGLVERVHFLGHQQNPFAFLSRSDIFVLASETEGLPNIIIEAMACGTPVISSDCISGPREILSPGSNYRVSVKNEVECATYGLLYPVGDVQLLVKAIVTLLSNEELSAHYSSLGKEYVAKFAKEKVAMAYIKQLRKLESSK